MTRPALAVVGGNSGRDGPIELRADDRLQSLAAPMRSLSWAMLALAIGSLLVHILLMAAAIVAARAPMVVPPQNEIAVEVVQEASKPPVQTPPAAPKTPDAKVLDQKAAAPAKVPEPAKIEPARIEPVKTEPVKTEPAPRDKPPAAPASSDPSQIKSLRDELASLRAEQSALKAATDAQEASGKALALPSVGTSDGDAIGYQQLVFSQLAKAKEGIAYRGSAGATVVKFEIDEAGKLVRAEVAQTSGNATLDGQALDIIHRAAPFPPPPTATDRIVFATVNFVPPKRP